MKKYTFALALVALLPFASASAYEYSRSQTKYYSTRPIVKTNTYKSASTSRKTGGYNNIITNNFYYGQPQDQSYYKPKQKSDNYYNKDYTLQERKFFLAHPFFQPLKGKFGSVTDFSYAHNRFDFDILNGSVLDIDPASGSHNTIIASDVVGISGRAENTQYVIKEDFSYGLTDNLTLLLMAQYDWTKSEFKDWSGGEPGNSKNTSGLNIFGIGLQGRFVDTPEWIAMGEAYFQHQKDAANTFMLGVKGGYKIDRTTIYGLGRVAYTNLTKGDTYGMFVDDPSGDYLMLSYNSRVNDLFQIEGGFGAFGVLNKYFTLNGEFTFGHYDWHNQLNVKGAIGWQPSSVFALNLYASTVLYDSAKGKTKEYMNYDVNPEGYATGLVYTMGDYKIKNYNEWKVGIQGILYF